MSNSLTVLINDVKKLLGLLNQVDTFAQSGGAGGRGGNLLGGSLGNVSTVAPGASTILATTGSLIKTGLTTAVGVAAGVSSMMPDVALTIGRQSAIYAGSRQSGSKFSTARLDQMMRTGLGNFQTSPGADARVLAMLTGRGMMPGTAAFNQTVTASMNAAKYLGMENEVSASAFENLTSGSTSMMMMRNYGIYTSDPRTGNVLNQNQIFGQIYDRFTAGRQKQTLEGTMESLRRGNLGASIRASGLDEAQQRLLSQYFIDRSRGFELDYSDTAAVDAQMKLDAAEGIVNPMLDPYRQNSISSELMSAATDEYILGIKDSTNAMEFLSKHVKDELIPTFGRLKAFIDNFAGSNIGGGALGAGAALLGGAMSTAGTLAGVGLGSKLGNKTPASSGKGSFVGMGAKASPLMKGVGPAAGVLSAGAIATGNMDLTAMSGAGTGAMLGSFAGPKGMVVGAILGAIVGGINQMLQGGNAAGGGGNIDPGPQGNNWTGAYGERRPYGIHDGIDIAMPVGTPLKAVMDGQVSFAGSGSGAMSRGIYLTIEHDGGYRTLYSHLSKLYVKQGDSVQKGQVIALSGNTGFSTGPHLHFSLYKNGQHINPGQFVGPQLYGGAGVSVPQGGDTGTTSGTQINSNMTSSGAGAVLTASQMFDQIAPLRGGNSNRSQGSLGVVGFRSAATNLPKPIKGPSGSGMMGSNLDSFTGTLRSRGAGGGYEPAGLSETRTSGATVLETISESSPITTTTRSSKSTVTINLTIAQASDSEARRFAKMVKEHIEEDNMLDKMGRR
jgi:hypothetical protein